MTVSDEQTEKILQVYRRSFTFTGEKIILVLVACCTVGISIAFRGKFLIDDLVALATSFIVVFLTLYCFESLSEKKRDSIYLEAVSTTDHEFEKSYKRRFITGVSLIFTFGMCVVTLIAKHFSSHNISS